MANSPDSVDSWPGLLAQLNKTFLVIRDVLGYALPGGVFLGIGLISKRITLFDLRNVLLPYQPPAWAVLILLVAACYIVGEILASAAYMPIAFRKRWQWQSQKQYLYPLSEQPAAFEVWRKANAAKVDLLKDNPTEVTGDLLEIRMRHPELFVESDRRETLMLLGGSLAMALLGGSLVFYVLKLRPLPLFVLAGILVLLQFFTAPSHLRRVRAAIREAAAKVKTSASKPDPDFPHLLEDLVTATTNALKKYGGS